MKQAIKKGAGVKAASFSIKDFKQNNLKTAPVADKEMEWYIMPKGFTDATGLPGIPKGFFSGTCGWNSTGKSTMKNCLIASAQKQGDLVVIFETESNFDFNYAKNCGMEVEPIYGDVEEVDEETGEVVVKKGIIDYDGNFILFTNEAICDYCGDIDYDTNTRKSTKRRIAVIEDIAYIMNDFLDKQESGELPVNILFIWDSVGSVISWKTYKSKVGGLAMNEAAAISQRFNSIVNTRIPSSRSQNYPYTNTFFIVGKLWDSSMQTMGKPSVKMKGGTSFEYALRLWFFQGRTITSGVKKLEATVKGEKYTYGTTAPIETKKNHLPEPFTVTREGTLYCTGHGILAEDEIDQYKKKILPTIIQKLKDGDKTGKLGDITEDDIEFIEEDAN